MHSISISVVPRIWTLKGCVWSKTEATPTLLMIGIYYDTIFHQKCNYCGVLSSFWRDEGCFKALNKGISDSTPFKTGLVTLLFLQYSLSLLPLPSSLQVRRNNMIRDIQGKLEKQRRLLHDEEEAVGGVNYQDYTAGELLQIESDKQGFRWVITSDYWLASSIREGIETPGVSPA